MFRFGRLAMGQVSASDKATTAHARGVVCGGARERRTDRPPGAFLSVGRKEISEADDEFAEFYLVNWPRLVAGLTWSIPPGVDADDVAQEAMAAAYERWRRVRSHERPDAWLFLTAYRLATSEWRLWAVRRRHSRTGTPAAPDVFDGLVLSELLHALEPRQRAVLLLRHHYGFSTRETARLLRCPEGTVKSLASRARAALEAAISQRGTQDE